MTARSMPNMAAHLLIFHNPYPTAISITPINVVRSEIAPEIILRSTRGTFDTTSTNTKKTSHITPKTEKQIETADIVTGLS
jgi:hypothetical protein